MMDLDGWPFLQKGFFLSFRLFPCPLCLTLFDWANPQIQAKLADLNLSAVRMKVLRGAGPIDAAGVDAI